MNRSKNVFPYFREINDFLAAIRSEHRTKNPHFFCFRLNANEKHISKYHPPFRKDFYFTALIANAGNTRIGYDNTKVSELNSFLVFQSPGLLYSFLRDNSANGYLIYFKKDLFSFFKPDFEKEFPFFNPLHTHFFRINSDKFSTLSLPFEQLFQFCDLPGSHQHKATPALLLALLYQLKDFTVMFNQAEAGFTTPHQFLFNRFIQLVNQYYLEKRSIQEYAEILTVTPNHLSDAIKKSSGQNALSFINRRLVEEAKSLIMFSTSDIAEIAYMLRFSDPANFGKFFKKQVGLTPLAFRKLNDQNIGP